jgi:hypothetical protein
MILKKQIDELTVEEFDFYASGTNLYLDRYLLLKKESKKKKKYSVLKLYSRLNARDSTIKEDQVPLTDEIKAEVIKQFTESIKCLKWSER